MGFGNWVDGLRLLLEISENKWRSILWRNIYIYIYIHLYIQIWRNKDDTYLAVGTFVRLRKLFRTLRRLAKIWAKGVTMRSSP
jgi:hypothetical protein